MEASTVSAVRGEAAARTPGTAAETGPVLAADPTGAADAGATSAPRRAAAAAVAARLLRRDWIMEELFSR
jgi:hypothetical protein